MIVLEKEYLTTDEVAERLKVDRETVLRWIRNRQLSAYKISKAWRISPTDLTEFLSKRRQEEESK